MVENKRYSKPNRFEYVSGKLSTVKVVRPDLEYNEWNVKIHPNNESLEKIRDMQAEGLKNQLKKDDDGYFTRFRRPVSRKTKRGDQWVFEPPKVFDKEGREMDGSAIGDGSDGIIKLEVYEHSTPNGGKAIAARLDSLRIDNLVPKITAPDIDPELHNQPPLF